MIKKRSHIAIYTLMLCFLSIAGFAQKQNGNTLPSPLNAVTTCQLYVATAFTPNDDGINDRFVVKYNGDCEMVKYSIKIFDRWGRLVYESENPEPSVAWDGTNDGKKVKEGVYMWKVYAKMIDPNKPTEAEIINKQGTLVLIR